MAKLKFPFKKKGNKVKPGTGTSARSSKDLKDQNAKMKNDPGLKKTTAKSTKKKLPSKAAKPSKTKKVNK